MGWEALGSVGGPALVNLETREEDNQHQLLAFTCTPTT